MNKEIGYLHLWKDWEWLPGVRSGLKTLGENGYLLVVVSNQAGIARGYYSVQDWNTLTSCINKDLKNFNTQINSFYFCPHHPEITGECCCRKPKPGLLLQAAKELNLDLQSSWMIGDKLGDVEAGKAAGCRPILLETGYGKKEKEKLEVGIPVFQNFSQAVEYILKHG